MRSLRPFAFALMWLVLFETLLRLFCAPDPRTVRDPEHPYGCFADDALARLADAREADAASQRATAATAATAAPPLDVVLLGDSVLASVENAPGQRLAEALQPALQRSFSPTISPPAAPTIRVWTLASGGARAVDVYAMLRRVDRVLRAGRRGTQGVLVVASSNAIFFSQRHRQPVMAYPCLAGELTDIGTDIGTDTAPDTGTDTGLATPELRAQLGVPGALDSPLGRLEHRLLSEATAHIYLLQQRRYLAEAIFGGPPRLAVRERLQQLRHRGPRSADSGPPTPDELAARDRPWTQRGLVAAQFASSYDFVPLDTPQATNLLWTRVLARWLGTHSDIASVAVLVPQNHALLGGLAAGPGYTAVGTQVAAAFGRAGVPYVSYDNDPALVSEHFLDLDHLTAAGNRALAARLAETLTPRLRALAGAR